MWSSLRLGLRAVSRLGFWLLVWLIRDLWGCSFWRYVRFLWGLQWLVDVATARDVVSSSAKAQYLSRLDF